MSLVSFLEDQDALFNEIFLELKSLFSAPGQKKTHHHLLSWLNVLAKNDWRKEQRGQCLIVKQLFKRKSNNIILQNLFQFRSLTLRPLPLL